MRPARSQFVTLCGRIFRDAQALYFPQVSHRDRTIYLCTQACMDAFLADPEEFYKAHRNSEKGKGAIEKGLLRHVE